MNLELPRRSILAVIAFFALSLALLWFMLARLGDVPLPGAPTESVRALLSNADGLTVQDDVLIRGVRVGSVTGVASRPPGTMVTLSLNAGTPHLRRDAAVSVGFKTPLGEPFVALDPGSDGSALPHGGAGATLRSTSTVEIDDALSFLDRAGRADARAALIELGRGAAARDTGQTESEALAALEQATARVGRLTAELSAQRGDLSRLVSDGGAVLSTLAARSTELHALTVGAHQTLQALAVQRPALAATLDRLPGLLSAARGTLLSVRPLIARATPVAAQLSAAAPALTHALEALPATSSAVERILAGAGAVQRDVVPALHRMMSLAAPAGTAIGELGPTLADLVPVARYLAPRGRTVAAWFANTADLGSHGDAKGDWARFFVMFDSSTLTGTPQGAPSGNSYTAPGDAAANRRYRPGGYPRLMPYSPALGKR
jgi:phospholipid/cholesterol/gamma-HCH transport system substrate-binding protein